MESWERSRSRPAMVTVGASENRPQRAESPLIGRAALLATLASERAVVLRGEPGSGKSRLLHEARVRDAGSLTATVRIHRSVDSTLEPIESVVATLERRSGLAAAPASADRRDRLFALRERLESLATSSPLLVQIDDLHRASPAALEAILYCVDRTEDSAIRWQFATRPGSDVDRGWSDAARDGVLRFAEVPPLDDIETRDLAVAIGGDVPEDLYRATGGNPLYVEYLTAAGGRSELGGLHALLENRLRELPSEPARLAAILAIARRPLDAADLLRATATGSIEAVRQAMAGLERAGIVRRVATGIEFAHDLLRDACVGLLSPSQSRELHASVAALSSTDIERAEHLLGAGRPEEARDVFLAAARTALAALSFGEASLLLARMKATGVLPAYASWETRALEIVTQAFTASGMPEFPAALAERAGVDPAIASAYLLAYLRTTGRPDYAAAVACVKSALDDPSIPAADRTAFRVARANGLANEHRFAEVLAASTPEAGEPSGTAASLELRALHAYAYGLVHDVAESRERLMTLAMDPEARTLDNLHVVFQQLADLEGMIDHPTAQMFWAKIGLEWTGATMEARRFYPNWASGALYSGRLREAIDACHAANAFAARRGLRPLAYALAYEAEAVAWSGDAERIEREFNERDVTPYIEHDRAHLAIAHGMLAEFRGELELADVRYRRVLDKKVPMHGHGAVALVYLTRVAALRGDAAAAEAYADDCIAILNWNGPHIDLCLFYAALAGNDAALLRARYERVLELAMPALERALVLAYFGERARDRNALMEALATFDASGAIRHVERFRSVARALGFRPGGARAVKSVLTPRENEIVQLVAEGLTNREVAARLSVSPKTVAAGVSAILEKCGLSSRIDIATRVASGRAFERA